MVHKKHLHTDVLAFSLTWHTRPANGTSTALILQHFVVVVYCYTVSTPKFRRPLYAAVYAGISFFAFALFFNVTGFAVCHRLSGARSAMSNCKVKNAFFLLTAGAFLDDLRLVH
jgi:hypothetical protein